MMSPRNREDNIVIDTLRCANKLWAIYRFLIIKKIHLS